MADKKDPSGTHPRSTPATPEPPPAEDTGTAIQPTRAMAVVSLNDLAMSIDSLTSSRLRDIIRAQGGPLEKIAQCGCDGGRCGCFGSDCPCNKVHNDLEDMYSIDEFVRLREAQLTKLRQQLEALQPSEEQINRLRK
jgi:hypothetical protein